VRVLANNQHIIWIVGIQLDERAKVKVEDKEVFLIKYKSIY